MISFTVSAISCGVAVAGVGMAATLAATALGPASPRGIVKFKITFSGVPPCVTKASVPGSPVVVVPTVTVGVVPSAPAAPSGPAGPVSPVGPVGPIGPASPVALVTYGIFFAMCARYSSRLWGLRNL